MCVCGVVRARVLSVLVCVSCVRGGVGVGVSSVCVGVCVCVCVGVWLGPAGACCWCGCGCGWCLPWLVPRHSSRRFLSAIPRHSWLGFAVGGGGCSSPLLAEGPGCGSPPLLAGVRWRRWCVVACHSWLRVQVAVPRHSWPLESAGGGFWVGPCHSWLWVSGAAPRHSWLGSAGGGGGCFRGWGFPVLCLLVARRVRVVPVLVSVVVCVFVVSVLVVVWVWAGLPRVFVCVCVCMRVLCVGGVRCGAMWCVGGVVAGVWCGWSLATPGGGSCVLDPATPGWVWLPLVVNVPRHSWLRVSGAAPRHSWLGSAGRGGGCFRRWGFGVLCVLVAQRVLVCALCVCGGGVGVGVSSVCVGACVAACGGLFPRLGLAAGVSAGRGVVGVWAVPRHSWRRFLRAFPRHIWPGFALGGGGCSLPLHAEGPGCGPLPLLAGVRRRWWCVVACPFWLWSWLRFPVTPGWGLPAAAVAVCVGLGGGFSWCVCSWRGACARGVCAGVCVVRSWWRGCGCVFRVFWCVCVCVWVCGRGRPGLAAVVGVGVVGLCRGWSVATPGGGS